MKEPKADLHWISLAEKQAKGGYSDLTDLEFPVDSKAVKIPASCLPISGSHNILNALCAGTAALMVGLSESQLISGYSSFKNAPHRMELIRQIDGVRFINDSKGTNVEATYYALGSFAEPMIWIAARRSCGGK